MPSDCHSLFRATIFSSTKLLQLLNQKCDPNVENPDDGLTPLCWSAFARKPDSAILLIAHRANVNKKLEISNHGLPIGITPMHAAAYSGALEVARILKENGSDLNARDAVGQTPLHYCACDSYMVVGALLEGGADPLQKDLEGNSPLSYSLLTFQDYDCGDPDYVFNVDKLCVLLLSKVKDVKKIKFSWGDTVLHLSINNRHKEVNEYIIKNLEVDLNARNDAGLTPLHIAAYSYMKEGWPTELLLDEGANPSISSNEGLSPLDIAINNGNDAAIAILRSAGAPENEKARELLNQKKAEASKNALENVHESKDTSPTGIFRTMDFPLSRGWFDELYDITRYLIFHKADVNAQDSKGHSPLHRAILGDSLTGNQQIRNLELYLGEIIIWPDLDEMKFPDIWEDYVKSI